MQVLNSGEVTKLLQEARDRGFTCSGVELVGCGESGIKYGLTMAYDGLTHGVRAVL